MVFGQDGNLEVLEDGDEGWMAQRFLTGFSDLLIVVRSDIVEASFELSAARDSQTPCLLPVEPDRARVA